MPAGHAEAARWVADPSCSDLLFRDFPDGSVCFDTATGETRLLSPLTRFLLELLTDAAPAPLGRDALVEQVLAVDETGGDALTARHLVDESLDELARSRLIRPGGNA